jgi:hypothetical protein
LVHAIGSYIISHQIENGLINTLVYGWIGGCGSLGCPSCASGTNNEPRGIV